MSTIKDVARLAGVSISTVSRAFSGKVFVDPETRRRIQEAAQALAYVPNHIARSLKEGRTNLIALLVPDLTNDIWPVIAYGAEQEARMRDYLVILCSTKESLDQEQSYIRRLRGNSVDGFIIASAQDNTQSLELLTSEGTPVVSILRGQVGLSDIVHMDDYDTAYRATEYLLQRGLRKPVMVSGNLRIGLFRQRIQGYLDALANFGIAEAERLVISAEGNAHQLYEKARNMLEEHGDIDALFASSDPQAICVMRAIKDTGRSIPKDVSVISIDDIPMSEMTDPALTTMSQPLYEIGRMAAKQLINRIEAGDKAASYEEICLKSKLCIRGSVK